MNISEKHNTAIRFLASIEPGRASLGAVASRGGISLSYLEQIAVPLRKDGFIRSTRGPGGGYELTRPLNDIKLVDLLMSIGMNGEGDSSALFDTILASLGDTTVAHVLTMANKKRQLNVTEC